jgi:hypothetical protein
VETGRSRWQIAIMTGAPDPEDVAVIRLDGDEAVVLFELLSRWSDAKGRATPSSECFESTAECAVLNSVLTDLERQLVAPFKSSYDDELREARTRLASRWDYFTQAAECPQWVESRHCINVSRTDRLGTKVAIM